MKINIYKKDKLVGERDQYDRKENEIDITYHYSQHHLKRMPAHRKVATSQSRQAAKNL